MIDHNTMIWPRSRSDVIGKWVATCKCGWFANCDTEGEAKSRATKHTEPLEAKVNNALGGAGMNLPWWEYRVTMTKEAIEMASERERRAKLI